LLRLSSVQTYITSKFSDRLSEDLNTKISVDRIDLKWYFDVELEGFYAEDLKGNPILEAPKLELDLDYLRMFDRQILIKKIDLYNAKLAYRKYTGDTFTNIQFILDHFKKEDSDTSESVAWDVQISGIGLYNTSVIYDMEDQDIIEEGFDYNHMVLENVSAELQNLHNQGDSTSFQLSNFEAYDKSGFQIRNFNSFVAINKNTLDLPNLSLHTEHSKIHGAIQFDFDSWKDWSEFVTQVKMKVRFDSTQLAVQDITYFSPSLKGMDETFVLHGKLSGRVDKLKAKDFLIGWDLKNWFYGDAKIHGLPDIEHSFIMVNAEELRVDVKSIASLSMPGGKTLPITDQVMRLGKIKADGRFTGFLNDFVANAKFNTSLGRLKTDVSIKPSDESGKLAYSGSFDLNKFEVGTFLASKRFGNLSMNGDIEGNGLDQYTRATAAVAIQDIDINGGRYENVELKAQLANQLLEFHMVSKDNRFLMNSSGVYNFGLETSEFELFSTIENARMARLLMSDQDTLGEISTNLVCHIVGDNLDNLKGQLILDSTDYFYQNEHYVSEYIEVKTNIENGVRDVKLISDFVDANVNGINNIAELEANLHQIMADLVPSLTGDTNYVFDKKMQFENNIGLELAFKEPKVINELFLKSLSIASGTQIKANFESKEDKLSLIGRAPTFGYNDYALSDIAFKIEKSQGITSSDISIQSVKLTDSLHVDSILLTSTIQTDTIQYHFHAGKNDNKRLYFDLNGDIKIQSSEQFAFEFKDSYLWLIDTLYEIENDNRIWVGANEFGAHNFHIKSKGSSISADGSVNREKTDSLALDFHQFNLSTLDPYTQSIFSNFDGILNGELVLISVHDYLDFLSEMDIVDFALNKTYLGNTSINAVWNKERNGASVNLNIYNAKENYQPFNVYGYYYPQAEEDNYDLLLNLSNFPAKAVERYLNSFSSILEGNLNGNLNIKGKTAAPEFTGKLAMDIKKFKVDYLNTVYSFKDEMLFEKDRISFAEAKFFDQEYKKGNKNVAIGDFELTHQDFQEIAIDLKITPTDMMLLNTNSDDNELFYGKAYGSGSVQIKGPLTALDFLVNVETSGGTMVSVPIIFSYQAEKADFITFISNEPTDTTKLVTIEEDIEDEYKYNMDLMFSLRPNAEISIVMDEAGEDAMKARGNGDIRITVDQDENVGIYGEYVITSGSYGSSTTLGKNFSIEEGSTISWDGDVEEAQLNIKAVHKIKNVNLNDLLANSDSTENNTQVNCVINITGDLYSPDITFDIELPNIEVSEQEKVNNMLSIGGEKSQDIINRNFVYLMVLGSFQPSQSASANQIDGSSSANYSSSISDLITSQINNVFNRLLDDNIDIGIEYNANKANTQEVAVVMSYSLLNNKLIINGKLGSGISTDAENKSSKMVGDVDIEYKIKEDGNIRLRAYNKTNYGNIARYQTDYTQGVGVIWRKEFDSFRIRPKQIEAPKDTIPPPTTPQDSTSTMDTNAVKSPVNFIK
jgi:hypothetical protein